MCASSKILDGYLIVAFKLQSIDGFLMRDHHYLEDGDECFFYGEYTARKGFSYSDTNDLILNFKKSVEKQGTPEWQHKELAVQEVANILTSLEAWTDLKNCTWVPIPSSKNKLHPQYDDRLLQTLKLMKISESGLDYRELITILQSREPAHRLDLRPSPCDHYANFEIERSLLQPNPSAIVIYDDVITTGSGFKAVKRLIEETFPGVRIIGVFVARTTRNSITDPET